MLVAAVCLLVLLNVLVFVGGMFSPTLDSIAHATPALLLVGVLVLFMAAGLGAPVVAAVALIGTVLPAGYVVALEAFHAAGSPGGRAPATLKVISVNLWSENHNRLAVEQFIADERPDVLLLQEAHASHFETLFESLDNLFQTHVSRHPHCSARILSTLQLIEVVEKRLAGSDCATATVRLRVPDRLGGGELLAASIHLPGMRRGNGSKSLYSTLRSSLRSLSDRSTIIGGDFNTTPWSSELRRFDRIKGLRRRTHAVFSWPALRTESTRFAMPAFLPIDHIFASDDWRTLSVRRGRPIGSDHYPVIVKLTRQEGK